MWIRNKGTRSRPNYYLIESRRFPSKQFPVQVVWRLGHNQDIRRIVRLWKSLAEDARLAKRQHVLIPERDRSNPLLMRYAKGMSLKKINQHLSKLKVGESRYLAWLSNKRERSTETMMDNPDFKAALQTLALAVSDIRRNFPVSEWPTSIRKTTKRALREIALFYRRL
jgi:hypothetical protein